MTLPLIDGLGRVTDENGKEFECPLGLCVSGPDASTLDPDRVWVCDECGARSLSWKLSPEHIEGKSK